MYLMYMRYLRRFKSLKKIFRRDLQKVVYEEVSKRGHLGYLSCTH